MIDEKEKKTRKQGGGRPSQGKKKIAHSLDGEVVDFLHSYHDGTRSFILNDWIVERPEFQASKFYEDWKRRVK